MLVEDFGYEDLIFKLAQEGITICLDDKRIEIFKRLDSLHFFHMNKNTAQIRLVDQFPSDIQRFVAFNNTKTDFVFKFPLIHEMLLFFSDILKRKKLYA